jgi:hypothetical protein
MAKRYLTIVEWLQEHGHEIPDEETLEKIDVYAQALCAARGVPVYHSRCRYDGDLIGDGILRDDDGNPINLTEDED